MKMQSTVTQLSCRIANIFLFYIIPVVRSNESIQRIYTELNVLSIEYNFPSVDIFYKQHIDREPIQYEIDIAILVFL